MLSRQFTFGRKVQEVKISPSKILYNNYHSLVPPSPEAGTPTQEKRDSLGESLNGDVADFPACRQEEGGHAASVLDEFCRKVLEKGEYPRLQVVEKDGHYFTLNNTRLGLFRRMEEAGHCRRVRVERVPLREIPEGIRLMMTVPQGYKAKHGRRASRRRGYVAVGEKDRRTAKAESSDHSSDESNSDPDDDSGTEDTDDGSSDDDDDYSTTDNEEEEEQEQEDESLL